MTIIHNIYIYKYVYCILTYRDKFTFFTTAIQCRLPTTQSFRSFSGLKGRLQGPEF